MSLLKSWLIGFGIFSFFAIATVWLPSKLLLGPLRTSSRSVQDIATLAVWGFFLMLGMWMLRRAQSRGWI